MLVYRYDISRQRSTNTNPSSDAHHRHSTSVSNGLLLLNTFPLIISDIIVCTHIAFGNVSLEFLETSAASHSFVSSLSNREAKRNYDQNCAFHCGVLLTLLQHGTFSSYCFSHYLCLLQLVSVYLILRHGIRLKKLNSDAFFELDFVGICVGKSTPVFLHTKLRNLSCFMSSFSRFEATVIMNYVIRCSAYLKNYLIDMLSTTSLRWT